MVKTSKGKSMKFEKFFSMISQEHAGEEVSRKDLRKFAEELDIDSEQIEKFLRKAIALCDKSPKRGLYVLPKSSKSPSKKIEIANISEETKVTPESLAFIPEVDKNYISWGHYKTIEKIIESRVFHPLFITGLSGNGKTMMVEQSCANLSRELFRVNITIETDEDDLLGGFRLVNGETVWFDGPVVKAMQRGGVLLLDEIDLASNKIMCIQSVLEGKGVFLKKVNRWVKPSEGFTIFATANTKGQGDELGKFVGTGFLNEAFLERFPITVVQSYPSKSIENKILRKFWKNQIGQLDEQAEVITENLVEWATITRDSFENGAINDLITTRRLISILQTYRIFESVEDSIKLTVNRFDDITRDSFVDLYKKISEVEEEEVPSEDPLVVESGETKAWFEN